MLHEIWVLILPSIAQDYIPFLVVVVVKFLLLLFARACGLGVQMKGGSNHPLTPEIYTSMLIFFGFLSTKTPRLWNF